MLRVKTKLGASPISGIGLFADEFIPKGTIIWEFDPFSDITYTESELNGANELYKDFLTTYCFKYEKIYYLCVDNARFFNHSDLPNCYSNNFNSKKIGDTRALIDIEIGTELTDDYSNFGLTNEDNDWNRLNN